MENRITGYLNNGGSNMDENSIPDLDIELEAGEDLYLVEIGVDFEDDEDSEEIVTQFVVRGREFKAFTKILTYNKISFMTTPLL